MSQRSDTDTLATSHTYFSDTELGGLLARNAAREHRPVIEFKWLIGA